LARDRAMRRMVFLGLAFLALVAVSMLAAPAFAEEKMFGDNAVKALQELLNSDKVSPQTKGCIQCHVKYTPDIVYEWAVSEHAKHPAKDAGKIYDEIGAPEWKNKIADWAKNYNYVVGCYECHGKFHDQDRPDIIPNHFGNKIVTIVTKKDCSQCHPKESAEISWTWHATGSLHASVLPWYKSILAAAKKMGANPFGDEKAKQLYEKYFPPYLTHQRDKDDIYWNFYKEFTKAVMEYAETGKENDIIKFVKQATGGYITPYDLDWKKWVSPLWPASGVLNTTVIPRLGIKVNVNAVGQFPATVGNVMSHPAYRNGYVYHACLECHGSLVIHYGKEQATVKTFNGETMTVERVKLWGWPSNGAARVDPDGSIGTCTACHDRHIFSLKQVRHAWTCGRCHLGYDHPHIEIYEESAHGNIENAYGHEWNWEALPWKVGVDFNAPTCATCHLSTIALKTPDGQVKIVVKGTHDLVARLVWNQMHFFAAPKPIVPDKVQESMFLHYNVLKGKMEDVKAAHEQLAKEGVPEQYQYPTFMGLKISDEHKPGEFGFPRMLKIEYSGALAQHREEMKKVCNACHSHQWVDNYFRTADQNMIDYDIVARYAFSLLQLAWKEGIADNKNILDEFPEIMWYYIWHHQGRRWRNGAFMMGPDFAHWFGIVDTVMEALGKMTNWVAMGLKVKALEQQLEAMKAAAQGGQLSPALAAKIAELEKQIAELKMQMAALEGSVPALQQQLQSVEGGFSQIEMQVNDLQTNVEQLAQQLQQLAQQLEQASKQMGAKPAEVKQLEQALAQLQDALKTLQETTKKAAEKASVAEEKASTAEKKAEAVTGLLNEIKKEVEEVSSKVDAVARNTYLLGGIALALAVIALGLAAAARRE
jgi:methyl-accepting chemotaxis protein